MLVIDECASSAASPPPQYYENSRALQGVPSRAPTPRAIHSGTQPRPASSPSTPIPNVPLRQPMPAHPSTRIPLVPQRLESDIPGSLLPGPGGRGPLRSEEQNRQHRPWDALPSPPSTPSPTIPQRRGAVVNPYQPSSTPTMQQRPYSTASMRAPASAVLHPEAQIRAGYNHPYEFGEGYQIAPTPSPPTPRSISRYPHTYYPDPAQNGSQIMYNQQHGPWEAHAPQHPDSRQPTPMQMSQSRAYLPVSLPNPQAMLKPDPDAQMGYNYQQGLLARCARGDHQWSKKYGVGGIITSVLCFPFGLFALLCDYEKKCDRCGVVVA